MDSAKLVNVVIPIYRNVLHPYERQSLEQVCRVLGRYPLTVIKPSGLCLDELADAYPQLSFESFDDSYFKGISGYNRLMMSETFYVRFSEFRYILIYQLDAYVFRDELAEWCHKDYDYIGAPWLVRPVYRFPLLRFTSWLKKEWCRLFRLPNGQITNFKVGNGGFSLRKVSSHLQATARLGETIRTFLAHPGNHVFNEDVFFSVEVNRHGLGFRYPEYMEALRFAFDKYPALCFRLNGGRLPFGCHSWYKRRMKKFWFPLILTT